jgi:N utilization substance protein B
MSRRSARIAAVEVLYGADVRCVPVDEVLADREDADAYCRHLVEGVDRLRGELDRLLTEHSVNWSTERMSPVDRNVLRVGVFELMEGDVPPVAVIDEAVEIAKRFSGDEAGRFVNGVLEGVRQAPGGATGGGDVGGSVVEGGEPPPSVDGGGSADAGSTG